VIRTGRDDLLYPELSDLDAAALASSYATIRANSAGRMWTSADQRSDHAQRLRLENRFTTTEVVYGPSGRFITFS
jgi:hypothetical protein